MQKLHTYLNLHHYIILQKPTLLLFMAYWTCQMERKRSIPKAPLPEGNSYLGNWLFRLKSDFSLSFFHLALFSGTNMFPYLYKVFLLLENCYSKQENAIWYIFSLSPSIYFNKSVITIPLLYSYSGRGAHLFLLFLH